MRIEDVGGLKALEFASRSFLPESLVRRRLRVLFRLYLADFDDGEVAYTGRRRVHFLDAT